MPEPFTSKFFSPIQNNISPNIDDGLDFVMCEQTFKVLVTGSQQECLSALCRATFNIVVYAGNDFNWLLHIYTICNLLWLKNYRMIFFVIAFFVGHRSRIYHKKGNVSIYFH